MSLHDDPPTVAASGIHAAYCSTTVYDDIVAERRRAHLKHAPKGNSMESRDYRDPHVVPVLVEEIGEVARAICDGEPSEHLYEELVQVSAMAAAWADAVAQRTRPAAS